jgi:hypothetical protein
MMSRVVQLMATNQVNWQPHFADKTNDLQVLSGKIKGGKKIDSNQPR